MMSMTMPDPDDIGKLFVGGLSSSTTKDSLQKYFSQYGEVVDSVVMKNNETGRSRGFGFVTFKDPNCVFKALQVRSHELDGKRIDPKECTPRSMQKGKKQAGKCKIFLGGLPPDITENDIRSGMSKFGQVDQVVIMMDQETKKCRGFGFLSFELEESIDQACAERYVIINGKQIECKRAEPRSRPNRPQDFSRNQNGVVKQAPYGQAFQSNWTMPNQPMYNMQGNAYSSYQSYGNAAAVPFNSSPVGFSNVQLPPYGQPFPQNFTAAVGGYNYSQVAPNTYAQPSFIANSHTQAGDTLTSAAAQTTLVDLVKSYGSNDYTQNSSAYGPIKASYGGANVASATLNNQGTSSTTYARYHPYKA